VGFRVAMAVADAQPLLKGRVSGASLALRDAAV
jgi:hypothetical protein